MAFSAKGRGAATPSYDIGKGVSFLPRIYLLIPIAAGWHMDMRKANLIPKNSSFSKPSPSNTPTIRHRSKALLPLRTTSRLLHGFRYPDSPGRKSIVASRKSQQVIPVHTRLSLLCSTTTKHWVKLTCSSRHDW